MELTYISLGFLIICICIGIALIIGFASISNYYIHITKEKLEVSSQQETSKTTTI